MLERTRKTMSIVSKLVFGWKNKNTIRMSGALIIDALSITANIGAPAVIADHFIKKTSHSDANNAQSDWPIYVAVSILFIAQILPRLRNLCIGPVRANVQKELALAMLVKSFDLELNRQLTERTGEFAQSLNNIYVSVDKGIPAFFGEITPITTEIITTSIFLMVWYQAIGVGILELGVLGVYIFAAAVLEKTATNIRNQCMIGSYVSYGNIISSMGNYIPAHQFGNVPYELEKIDGSLTYAEKLYRLVHRKNDITGLILALINNIGLASILAVAALTPKKFEVISFLLVSYYMIRFNYILNILAPAISTFNTAISDAQKVVDFLTKESLVSDPENPITLQLDRPPRIEFRNVTFRYGDRTILNDVSFIIEPSSKFAIVGASGSGKSTILNLLLRFYKPEEGVILINNQDIQTLSAASLRDYMAVVGQSSTLFNDTVFANIHYGKLNALPEAVNSAATVAQLDSDRLQALAGEGGGKLSGGERQRTSMARAVLKGGLVCLLDEPTSALDPETERALQTKIDELTANSTTIIATHRLNTIMNASQIIYLKDGSIVETGTFNQLMGLRSAFFNQFMVQCQELGLNDAQINALITTPTPVAAPALQSNQIGFGFWQNRHNRHIQSMDVNPHTPLLENARAAPYTPSSPRSH